MCIEAIVVCPDFMNDVSDQYKTREMYIRVVEKDPGQLHAVPDRFKTRKRCDDVVRRDPYYLQLVPKHLKTKEMCEKVVEKRPYLLYDVPEHLKTKEMYEKVVEGRPYLLYYVPEHLKMKEMYEKVVDLGLLKYVPDWFVTQQQIKIWRDDDELIQGYKGYQKRKAQKAKIKEEPLPIAWHPDRVMDWCMPEDEKRLWK